MITGIYHMQARQLEMRCRELYPHISWRVIGSNWQDDIASLEQFVVHSSVTINRGKIEVKTVLSRDVFMDIGAINCAHDIAGEFRARVDNYLTERPTPELHFGDDEWIHYQNLLD